MLLLLTGEWQTICYNKPKSSFYISRLIIGGVDSKIPNENTNSIFEVVWTNTVCGVTLKYTDSTDNISHDPTLLHILIKLHLLFSLFGLRDGEQQKCHTVHLTVLSSLTSLPLVSWLTELHGSVSDSSHGTFLRGSNCGWSSVQRG